LRKIPLMKTDQLSMLALLEAHANTQGDTLAHVLPLRDITYRRLWSRIERGSARLHGEWGVKAGDLVAYVGHGHPDAIVLYFSLLRIGASLLPLESMPLPDVQQLLAAKRPVLVVHDADMQSGISHAHPLEALLAVWSHHDAPIAADDMTRRALWLPDSNGQWQATSLIELCAALPTAPRSGFITDRIFSADLLAHVVLPSLRDARQMQFAATDKLADTGS
jgi:acyl-CoA synthetase (AMP-forming)/AMP-acid ligase II